MTYPLPIPGLTLQAANVLCDGQSVFLFRNVAQVRDHNPLARSDDMKNALIRVLKNRSTDECLDSSIERTRHRSFSISFFSVANQAVALEVNPTLSHHFRTEIS